MMFNELFIQGLGIPEFKDIMKRKKKRQTITSNLLRIQIPAMASASFKTISTLAMSLNFSFIDFCHS